MSDERRNRPSASNIERYWNCRGAWLLEQQVPESERFATEDAERGTRLHLANESGQVENLELSEQDLIVRTREIEERIYNQWCEEFSITDAEIIRERRFWLTEETPELCSAKLDFVAISQKTHRALSLDLKSGRKPVPPAPRNWQLRTGAVILAANYGLIGVRVGIVAPIQKIQPLADYSNEHLFDAWQQLEKLLNEIENPNAERTPGSWCEFCPASHICPEAKSRMLQVSSLEGLKWSLLPAAEKVRLWDAWKLAQVIGQQIEQNIRAEVTANPEAFKEWLVKKPDIPVRQVADVAGVYATMEKELNLDPKEFSPEFTKLCSMTVGDLKTLVREKTGKGDKEADLWINRVLGAFLTKKPRQGSIERVTK